MIHNNWWKWIYQTKQMSSRKYVVRHKYSENGTRTTTLTTNIRRYRVHVNLYSSCLKPYECVRFLCYLCAAWHVSCVHVYVLYNMKHGICHLQKQKCLKYFYATYWKREEENWRTPYICTVQWKTSLYLVHRDYIVACGVVDAANGWSQ